jgi:hypothetical protein
MSSPVQPMFIKSRVTTICQNLCKRTLFRARLHKDCLQVAKWDKRTVQSDPVQFVSVFMAEVIQASDCLDYFGGFPDDVKTARVDV